MPARHISEKNLQSNNVKFQQPSYGMPADHADCTMAWEAFAVWTMTGAVDSTSQLPFDDVNRNDTSIERMLREGRVVVLCQMM